jgi:hypothetical protein
MQILQQKFFPRHRHTRLSSQKKKGVTLDQKITLLGNFCPANGIKFGTESHHGHQKSGVVGEDVGAKFEKNDGEME